MGERLLGWRRLNWHDRVRITGLALLLVPVHASLLVFGYARTRHWLERLSTAPDLLPPTPCDITQAWRLAELASIAGRHGLVNANCLRHSLLLHFLLRRRRLAPALMLGVRRRGESDMDAHAWVQLGDTALGQTGLAHTALPGHAWQRQAK